MANILNTIMGSKTVETVEQDANGVAQTVEKVVPVVREVTFMLDKDTPHTLTFLPEGTKIKDGRGVEKVIGDANTVYHEFTDAAEAVQAYLDGKV